MTPSAARTIDTVGPPDGRLVEPRSPWYRLDPAEAANELDVDVARGLSESEAVRRREQTGPNELVGEPKRPWWKRLLDQFRGVLILLLLGAAVISAAVGDLKDPIVIGVVVIINALLGFVQEQRADQAMEALSGMLTTQAKVRRDGAVEEIASADVVPGDLVLLKSGDRIPADGRFVKANSLSVDESTLTGESEPVDKDEPSLPAGEGEVALADRSNIGHMNTTVVRGTAELLITETGMSTELGRLAGMISADEPGLTPLQEELERLGKRLAVIAGVAVALVIAVGMLRGDTFAAAILGGVALAVAAIPEGLPAVVTVTLALGVRRMAEHNAIVKRLASVETLGSTTVICSDKTGTLTLHQMTATQAWCGGRTHEIDGLGYGPDGTIDPPATDAVRRMVTAAALASDAVLRAGADGTHELVGDPTEGALIVLAGKAGVTAESVRADLPRLAVLPFDSTRKLMATVTEDPFGGPGRLLAVKGGSDVVFGRCTAMLVADGIADLDEARRAGATEVMRSLGADGLRVLAIAGKELAADWDGDPDDELDDLVLYGVVGILDPPRMEAGVAIAECRDAGIAVKMITGDHATTAAAIGQQLGLDGEVVTGSDLDAMSDDELAGRIEAISVCARVSPEHKVRVVRALQANDEVVAMTGDGVNDAAALRRAEIGVAMGITGTEVTKEASDLVLADDNFATIVTAVERGRAIRSNIVHFVRFQLTTSLAAVGTILAARILDLPIPFSPIQILFVNIIADGPPAMSLGVDPPAPEVMKRKPLGRTEPILTNTRLRRILATTALMSAAIIWVLVRYRSADPLLASTMAFTTFVFAQLVNSLIVRSDGKGVFRRYTFSNGALWMTIAAVSAMQVAVVEVPVLQRIFDTVGLTWAQWGLCLAVVAALLFVEEVWIRVRLLIWPDTDLT
ncbi:MAG: cation-translocating P-type ATPase [Candidatus Microthrix sp.]|jgi:Ca2+-transporting ATPase|uniref:Cation-translocating P-type ATPase n=1 Tax=Candidatus Neomicrothrix subdominans TaxID=2954438 RepID=A0A936TFC4_9ACTN|nr:cation-translocating P-type ATPase [Candidatus Microthrix subdominans]MBP7596179.1 cation-translocating P-type ATPase [Candidatus Microthrix sp.]MBP9066531.1 cation-translocating P-type ATPase [Candidatus Microthrix sp.]